MELKWNNASDTNFDIKIDFMDLDGGKICNYYNNNFNPSTGPSKINGSPYIDDYSSVYVQIKLDEHLIFKNNLLVN